MVRRALLVDDDPELRDMLGRHFRRLGFETVSCGTAEDAWWQLNASAFDVVVTDVHLPGGSGLELAHRMNAAQVGCPVVVITGDRDALPRTDAVACLLKPFDLVELDAAVSLAISRHEVLELLSEATRGHDAPATLGALLAWADEHCGTEPGHGYRTSLFARQIAAHLLPGATQREFDALEEAARFHELGVLLAPLAPPHVQAASAAAMLVARGASPLAARLLRLLDAPESELAAAPAEVRTLTRSLLLADQLDHALSNGTESALTALEARLDRQDGTLRESLSMTLAFCGLKAA